MIELKTLYAEYQAEWSEVLKKATKIAQKKGLRVPKNTERDARYALGLIGVSSSFAEIIDVPGEAMIIRWLD